MFPNNSLFSGLAKVILTLVVIGILVGLVLASSDLANFITNSAKVQAIKNQNDYQAQKNAIDIKNYKILQDTVTHNQIDLVSADNAAHQKSLEQDLQFQAQKADQALEMDRYLSYAGIGSGMFLAFCIGIGVIVLMILFGRSRLIAAWAQTRQADPWQDPIWRKHQLQILRQQDQVIREIRAGEAARASTVSPFIVEETPIAWKDLQDQYIETRKP